MIRVIPFIFFWLLWGGSDAWATCQAQSAAPAFPENFTMAASSCDLAGNQRSTLGTLLSGEDQTNDLIQTSGGKVRVTTLASAVTTDTTSTAIAVPTGTKSLYGQVVCDSGACVQTQKVYGDINNDAANGVLLCTLTLTADTRDQAACSPLTANFSYYYIVTTSTSGTNAAGAVYAMY